MKTKSLFLTLVLLALGGSLFGQKITGTPGTLVGGDMNASSAACATARSCVWATLSPNASSLSVTLSGTWSATILAEQSADGGTTWTTVAASLANGLTTYTVTSMTDFRVRVSAYTSGIASVTLSVGLLQVQSVVASSSSSSSSSLTVNIVDATNPTYGLKADVFYVTDATITSGTSTLSLPNADYTFTSADAGKIIFCTNETTDTSALSSVVRLPQGTISTIVSGSSITVSTTATASLVGVATCAWGHDDSAALTAAWAVASAKCGTLLLPTGWMFIQTPLFNTAAAYCSLANRAVQLANGVAITGWGPGSTVLVILPGMDPTQCLFGASSIGCWFGAPAMQVSNLSMFGLGNSNPGAGFNSKIAIALDNNPGTANPMMLNVGMYGWGAAQGSGVNGLIGVKINGSNPRIVNAFSDAFGYHALNGGGSDLLLITASTFAVNTGTSLTCSGGKLSSSNGVWTWTTDGSTRAINIAVGCVADFFGDEMDFVTNPGQTTLGAVGAGAIARLHGVKINQNSGTGFALAAQTGGQIHADGSTITSAGTAIFTDATGQFFDDCGNTITGTITAGSNAAIVGNCSVDTTALATGNVVPSANWGTSAAITAPFGQTRDVSFTLTNGSAAVGANPTLTYTYPKAFLVRPNYCTIQQTGGTQAQIVNEWSVGTPSATSVVFTYNGTPTINLTEFIAVSCH